MLTLLVISNEAGLSKVIEFVEDIQVPSNFNLTCFINNKCLDGVDLGD